MRSTVRSFWTAARLKSGGCESNALQLPAPLWFRPAHVSLRCDGCSKSDADLWQHTGSAFATLQSRRTPKRKRILACDPSLNGQEPLFHRVQGRDRLRERG